MRPPPGRCVILAVQVGLPLRRGTWNSGGLAEEIEICPQRAQALGPCGLSEAWGMVEG